MCVCTKLEINASLTSRRKRKTCQKLTHTLSPPTNIQIFLPHSFRDFNRFSLSTSSLSLSSSLLFHSQPIPEPESSSVFFFLFVLQPCRAVFYSSFRIHLSIIFAVPFKFYVCISIENLCVEATYCRKNNTTERRRRRKKSHNP